jgi:uracil-DNA glycosylase
MTIQEYFGDWSKLVDLNEADRILRRLSTSHYIICPQLKDIFKAFRLCTLNDLRVVIIGQDPYPQNGIATGIAFANSPSTPSESYSASLEVLKESVIDYTIPHR